jgi:hypothetical protein
MSYESCDDLPLVSLWQINALVVAHTTVSARTPRSGYRLKCRMLQGSSCCGGRRPGLSPLRRACLHAPCSYSLEGRLQPRGDDALKGRAPRAFDVAVGTVRRSPGQGPPWSESRRNSQRQGRPRAITLTARSVGGHRGIETGHEHCLGVVTWVIVDRQRGNRPRKHQHQYRDRNCPAPPPEHTQRPRMAKAPRAETLAPLSFGSGPRDRLHGSPP